MMVAILRLSIMTTRCVFRKGQAVGRNLVVDCREEEGEQLNTVVAIVKLLLRFGAIVGVQMMNERSGLDAGANGDTQDEVSSCIDMLMNARNDVPSNHDVLVVKMERHRFTTVPKKSRREIDVADADGITPIQFVLQRANLHVLQLFLNHHQLVATPQRQDFARSVLLSSAAFIVDNGYAPVTVYNKKGETAMHRAILRNSPSVMELISDLDLDSDTLTAVTMQRETPAHYASAHGSAREVETLLLCLTRVFGDLEELERLSETNPLNVADETGMTSLFIAAVRPRMALIATTTTTFSSRPRRQSAVAPGSR
ncbi:Ankyrin repeat-containing domain [Phytophthora cactorum]|nr:Ankyrin repeat-containing domain [Phytophthora cactorum]